MSLWARADLNEPAHGRGRLRLLSPAGTTITETDFEIDVAGTHKRYRATVHFEGFPLHGPGKYTVRTDFWDGSDWKEVASVPLEIVFEPSSEAHQAEAT